ncbi:dihydropyrimidinase [Lachnospiraceae bacterium 1_4_56FAA]|nr:dihydropyrimidinase [Lachnospiraceae bacterium 1_4_56FAA]
MKTIVKNGKIVSPSETYEADLCIENGVISCIGTDLEQKFASDEVQVIDAAGKYVLPGGVDVHTHMDLDVGFSRAVDDFYDGTVAAACGGTTSIVDHMAFGPAGCNLHHQLNEYHRLADDKAVIDYGFHGTVQHVNDEILDELESMVEDGVPSVKVYLTYGFKINDDGVLEVLKRMKELNGITAFHCENHDVVEHLKKEYSESGKTAPIYHAKSRPNIAEAEAVRRVLYLAKLAGDAPVYIVHLSCKESLEAVEEARKAGQKNIFVETCTQYLTMTEEKYKDEDGLKYIMSPPLRTDADREALWKGLENGEIQIVATDHCPFNYGIEKQMGKDDFTKCPNGAPGVEERMILLFSEGVMKNRISLNRFVEVACTNPAKVYGLYPKKGILEPGADADLIILDPEREQTLTHANMHGAVDYTVYEGVPVKGYIDLVMQRGNVIAKENRFTGARGAGEFIHRKTRDLKDESSCLR